MKREDNKRKQTQKYQYIQLETPSKTVGELRASEG
jgi:hypothetical protein